MANDRLRGPDCDDSSLNSSNDDPSILEKIASYPVHFYREYLASQWGPHCSFYPSCSQYSLDAIKKQGIFGGAILTFDRLQHEADEYKIAPRILINDKVQFLDPVENNDFWWTWNDR